MTIVVSAGDKFLDIALPDHRNALIRLSSLTAPSLQDQKLGFFDGYPLILVFYRGFFCPRDLAQMRQLARFQDEMDVNYAQLAAVSVDPPLERAVAVPIRRQARRRQATRDPRRDRG